MTNMSSDQNLTSLSSDGDDDPANEVAIATSDPPTHYIVMETPGDELQVCLPDGTTGMIMDQELASSLKTEATDLSISMETEDGKPFSRIFQFSVKCTGFSVKCTGFSVKCTGFSVKCTGFSVKCTGFSVKCTGFSVKCTGFSVKCTGFSVKCTGFSVKCTGFSVKCTGFFLT